MNHSSSFRLLRIVKSPFLGKKKRAIFSDGSHTDFGAKGYEDFLIHKDVSRRTAYRQRHQYDHLDDPKSAGALSWWILWGDTTSLEKNIAAYKRHFGV